MNSPQNKGRFHELLKSMNFLQDKWHLRNLLIGYWLLVLIGFLLYVGLIMLNSGGNFYDLLKKIPTLSVGLLVACLTAIMAYLLYQMTSNHVEKSNLKAFSFFAVIQQLLAVNLIGAALAYLYWKKVDKTSEKFSYLEILSISFISLFTLLATALLIKNTI
ncbi:MAG: hypothetical protein LBI11_05330 [Streptococcaceae bacterium]|jgi:hypothetical protein|nr:hypothetical protein [Streptococcaceae bacterium]